MYSNIGITKRYFYEKEILQCNGQSAKVQNIWNVAWIDEITDSTQIDWRKQKYLHIFVAKWGLEISKLIWFDSAKNTYT